MVWECQACGYIYDPQNTDAASKRSKSADNSVFPQDWTCPICGVGAEFFEEVNEEGD